MTKSEKITHAEEINKMACDKPEMPDGLCLPEQLLFQSLRSLYYQYSQGFIKREQATAEKKRLIEAYTLWQLHYDAIKQTAESLVILGERLSECYKNKDNCPTCKAIAERWGHSDYGKEYEFKDGEVKEIGKINK